MLVLVVGNYIYAAKVYCLCYNTQCTCMYQSQLTEHSH